MEEDYFDDFELDDFDYFEKQFDYDEDYYLGDRSSYYDGGDDGNAWEFDDEDY